jgi:site-specific recombinase XerD
MLIDYFKSPLTLERYRSASVGPHLDAFTEWLDERGYRRVSVRRHVREVVHFATWAKRTGIPVEVFNRDALDRLHSYLAKRELLRYRNGGHQHLYQSAAVFISFFDATGIVCRSRSRTTMPSPTEMLWQEFTDWMRAQRGTMNITLANYRLPVTALLQDLKTDTGVFTAERLRQFLQQQVKQSSQAQSKNLVTALRMFLRFLIARGDCPTGLDYAIPTVAGWRLAVLPKYLPAHDVERLIHSCDPSSTLGARDQAILLLMARLGLRAGDVSALRFRDLRWSDAALIVSGKNRSETRLPLPQDVGDAVLYYLRHARPGVSNEHVFITSSAPRVPISRQAVGRAVRRALRRTGISAPTEGAHLLRHSAATSLLRDGASLQAIGALLRHASIDTTTGYAKVDVGLLSKIAMPWPEVSSC